MNGPQHYREAETALAIMRAEATNLDDADRAALIAIAGVHATLAKVAAYVEAEVLNRRDDWSEAIS